MSTLLTKKEVAAQLQVSEWKVCQLIKENLLPVVLVGKRTRIRPAAVSDFIQEQERHLGQAAPDPDVLVISAYREAV